MIHWMPAESSDEGAATRGYLLQSINAPAKVHCKALDLTEGLDSWQGRIAGKDGQSVDVRTNWLALHLADSDIPRWALLAEAVGEDPLPALEAGRRLGVLYEAPSPPVDGHDLQRWGMEPGRDLGMALGLLQGARLKMEIATKDDAKQWLEQRGILGG